MAETRALLVTDVVDSTQLAQSLGDVAMAALWARHDRLARDLLTPHHGREIDKTDGFLLMFDDATDAVAYAVAYHEAIASLDPPLKARAGLHVGSVILTENPAADVARGAKPLEVDGPAKATAARVMGLALGGQTLLTEAARAQLPRSPLRVEDHGWWRLKGVAEPMAIYEIGAVDAPFTPPPDSPKLYRVVQDGDVWLPAREVRHNLPRERDAFVGRASDLDELARRLDQGAALVSILGIGGTGKTRLATRFAWTWLGDWPGGAWFCDLSEARDVGGVTSAVAQALDVPLSGKDDVVQLGHAIAARGKCLVLLDNFEQVGRHAAETLGVWLDRAPEAQFVVTTREVLGLPGETALALAPLREAEAVDLFVTRATQARREFSLTPEERPDVEALVKLLDALPLALELAAARVRVMPPRALLQRMSERFKLLSSAGGRRTRQATLRATLDWSWDLLSADEQRALAQLSVFEGGFTLDAAESVLVLDEAWPVDAVQALVDKSLVRRVSEERLDLLVSVQEYAAEKLVSLEGAASAEQRHGAFFAAFGSREALTALELHGGVARRRALQVELDNVVAACRRAIRRLDPDQAVPTLEAACAVLELRGPVAGAAELAAAVATLPLPPTRAARVALRSAGAARLLGRGADAAGDYESALRTYREAGDHRTEALVLGELSKTHRELGRIDEARAEAEAELALARVHGTDREVAIALVDVASVHRAEGRTDEAHAGLTRALELQRARGNRAAEGVLLGNLGTLCMERGRMPEARAHLEAALAIHREVTDREDGGVLANLGILHLEQGRLDEARATFDRALAAVRGLGNRVFEGMILGNLGALHLQRKSWEAASAYFTAALAIHREVKNRRTEGLVLGNLGNLHHELGRDAEAVAFYAEALAVHRELGNRRFEGHVEGNLGRHHADRGDLASARRHFDAGADLLRAVDARGALGHLLARRAQLAVAEGNAAAAEADLAEAESIAAAVGAGPDSEFGLELNRGRAVVASARNGPASGVDDAASQR